MSTAQARVVAIDDHSVQLSVAEQSACGGCRSKSACGVGTTRDLPVDEETRQRLRIGDQVEVSMPTTLTLSLALMLYLPPVAGFIGGMLLAGALDSGDSAMLCCAVMGLIGGFALTRFMGRFVKPAPPTLRIL
jgi:sigma-E factor negative regulatory protein RseC